MGDAEGFNLRRMRGDAFSTFQQLEEELQRRNAEIEDERMELQEQRERTQRRRDALNEMLDDLEQQRVAASSASTGLFSCCSRPPARKE
mmetsp:Transcript_132623/g.383415  ORF Transcript_132623/g.383415 Transcript_132623/m.383415 type:complete len:89 (-) Transcript_132623:180-446(-)